MIFLEKDSLDINQLLDLMKNILWIILEENLKNGNFNFNIQMILILLF